MENMDLRNEYARLEENYSRIIKLLEKKKDGEYKGLYKGIATMLSPLVDNPKIMFIGINAGDGAYNVINSEKTNNTPSKYLGGKNESCFNEHNWFEKGNARGYFKDKKKKESWTPYEWYQRDKRINNIFPKNMIDILYNVAKQLEPNKQTNNTELPYWYEDLGQKIMNTNLYPIMTENTGDLNKVFDLLLKEPELQDLWVPINGKKDNRWCVQLFFVEQMRKQIKLFKPQLIVSCGTQAFNDLIYKNEKKNDTLFKDEIKLNDITYPVLGFSRKGGWNGKGNLERIGNVIAKIIK